MVKVEHSLGWQKKPTLVRLKTTAFSVGLFCSPLGMATVVTLLGPNPVQRIRIRVEMLVHHVTLFRRYTMRLTRDLGELFLSPYRTHNAPPGIVLLGRQA